MNIVSIKSFWNNGFDEGCDKEKLLVGAKDDINKLIEEIEILQNALDKVIDKNNETAQEKNKYKKALIEVSKMKEVGFAPEYVLRRYSEYANDVLNGKEV